MTEIINVTAREILDSRGNPTVEVEVAVGTGRRRPRRGPVRARRPASTRRSSCATATSGATSARASARPSRTSSRRIAPAVVGHRRERPGAARPRMLELDGTPTKSKLGANAILGVSLAGARAAAQALGLPLYRYVGGAGARTLPVPLMNILNGGAHADTNVDIQEFMVVPARRADVRRGAPLRRRGVPRAEEGPEGRRASHRRRRRGRLRARTSPRTRRRSSSSCEAIEARRLQARRAGGARARRAPRASSSTKRGQVQARGRGQGVRRPRGWSTATPALAAKYPIVSIEDGFAEDDWDGWKLLTERLGSKRPARRRRPVRHERRRGLPRHRARASRTPSS